jgi:hypothetical protein
MASEDEKTTPQLDEDDNPIVIEVGSKLGTSKTPTFEDLMKKLEKLKAGNKRLKEKGKRAITYSSSSEDDDSSFEEEVSNKGRKGRNKHDSLLITLCLSITITCQTIPLILPYPLVRLPISMGQTITNGSIA